jgi:hypothetical protein
LTLIAELKHVGAAMKRSAEPYVASATYAMKQVGSKISQTVGSQSVAFYDEKTGERIDPKTGKPWKQATSTSTAYVPPSSSIEAGLSQQPPEYYGKTQ